MDLGGWQIFRLSGTGSVGATIRLYIEQYVKDASKTGLQAKEVMAPLVSNSTIASILHSTVTIVIAFRRQNWDVRMDFGIRSSWLYIDVSCYLLVYNILCFPTTITNHHVVTKVLIHIFVILDKSLNKLVHTNVLSCWAFHMSCVDFC